MKILIEGDSWAYVWKQTAEGNIPTPGFSKFLQAAGHEVVVNAQAGSSNQRVIDRITKYTDSYDLVIWLQTEPMRDWFTDIEVYDRVGNARKQLDYKHVLDNVDRLGSLDAVISEHLRTVTYPGISSASQAPVWAIGGCSPLVKGLVDQQSRMTCVLPSFPQWLLDNSYSECFYQDTHQWSTHEYVKEAMKRGNVRTIQDWYSVTTRMEDKLQAWKQDTVYFKPDEWHPNIGGHQRLADLLLSRF